MTDRRRKTAAELAEDRRYQQAYYARNRDKIAAEKQTRYRTDPAYRNAVKSQAQQRYWLKSRSWKGDDAGVPVGHVTPRGTDDILTREGRLAAQLIYSTAEVSLLLGRSVQTIRQWFRDGILPEPRFRARQLATLKIQGKDARILTLPEMIVLDKAKTLLHPRNYKDFTNAIKQGFKELKQHG